MAGWVEANILSGYGTWNAWLGPTVVVACVVAAVLLVLGRLGVRFALSDDFTLQFDPSVSLAVVLFGVLALFAAPAAFAAESVSGGNGAQWLPQAGPSIGFGFGGGPGADVLADLAAAEALAARGLDQRTAGLRWPLRWLRWG